MVLLNDMDSQNPNEKTTPQIDAWQHSQKAPKSSKMCAAQTFVF
jgi:hypothetical protein